MAWEGRVPPESGWDRLDKTDIPGSRPTPSSHDKRSCTHVATDIRLEAELIEVVVNLGQNLGGLSEVADKLGHADEVVRLAAGLLDRVVDEDGVALVPALALGKAGMRDRDLWVQPQSGQALVDLDALGVVVDEAVPLRLVRDQVVDHGADVGRLGRRPDGNPEAREEVVEKGQCVRSGDEGLGVLGRAVEEGAVQVQDDQYRLGAFEAKWHLGSEH
ncbi:hypothetical protein PspLS_05765 [Pyricularia sp. CBS 133598]|nr:hypothetical protein PspLS_05765 [Pyricularia sp. CBS 133598]